MLFQWGKKKLAEEKHPMQNINRADLPMINIHDIQNNRQLEVKTIIFEELVMKYYKMYLELYECERDADNVLHIFDKMFSEYPVNDIKILKKLIISLSNEIVGYYEKYMNTKAERDFNEMENVLIEVWIRLIKKYDISNSDFYDIFNEVFYHNRGQDVELPWSFDSFNSAIEFIENIGFDNDLAYKIQDIIEKIWIDYFSEFLTYADENSIKALKLADCSLDMDTNWGDLLYERYTDFDREICTSQGIQYFISLYYPELEHDVIEAVFHGIIVSIEEKDSIVEQDFNDIMDILQVFKDSIKYNNNVIKFGIIFYNWEWIIKVVYNKLDGIVLNEMIDFIVNYGRVPKHEMESFIIQMTLKLLKDTNVEPIEKLMRINKLLSNPIVFQIVADEDYSLIKVFSK